MLAYTTFSNLKINVHIYVFMNIWFQVKFSFLENDYLKLKRILSFSKESTSLKSCSPSDGFTLDWVNWNCKLFLDLIL